MANYAYYALHKLHILPSVFLELDEQEKPLLSPRSRSKWKTIKRKKEN